MKRSGAVSSLQGPRPQPLSLPPPPPSRPSKRPRVNGGGEDDDDDAGVRPASAGPVIVYEHTPRVIHAKPDEFKALVQRLTGRQLPAQPAASDQTTTSSSSQVEEDTTATVDPLVLTLGKQALPLNGRTPLQLPSPGGGLAADTGFLFSPGSFLFSPATLQAIQELISS